MSEHVLELRLRQGAPAGPTMHHYYVSIALHGKTRDIYSIVATDPDDATVQFADVFAYMLDMGKRLVRKSYE